MSGLCDELLRYLCYIGCDICAAISLDCATYRRNCTAGLCECQCCRDRGNDEEYANEREALLAENRSHTEDASGSQSKMKGIESQQPSATSPPAANLSGS